MVLVRQPNIGPETYLYFVCGIFVLEYACKMLSLGHFYNRNWYLTVSFACLTKRSGGAVITLKTRGGTDFCRLLTPPERSWWDKQSLYFGINSLRAKFLLARFDTIEHLIIVHWMTSLYWQTGDLVERGRIWRNSQFVISMATDLFFIAKFICWNKFKGILCPHWTDSRKFFVISFK
jgi:hypothetical protein